MGIKGSEIPVGWEGFVFPVSVLNVSGEQHLLTGGFMGRVYCSKRDLNDEFV